MGSYMSDISGYISGTSSTSPNYVQTSGKASLDMTDFLTLMVTEMSNQTIDSAADTSDMLNQLVQMQMVQAITNMTDASVMSYASSLVGKEVTVGQMDKNNEIKEHVGIVTGTGMMNGQQVVFVDDKYYFLSEIMAVGRLPEKPKPDEKPDDVKPGEKPDGTPGAKPDGKPEVKPDAKPEGAPEVKPDAKPESAPDVKPEEKPAEVPQVKPEGETEVKPETAPSNGETDKIPEAPVTPAPEAAPEEAEKPTEDVPPAAAVLG